MQLTAKDRNVIPWIDQIFFGLILSMGIGGAVWDKSWGPIRFWLAFGVIAWLPSVGSRLLKSQQPRARLLGKLLLSAFAVVLLIGVLDIADRIYLTNGASYPAWLTQRDIGPVTRATFGHLAMNECKGHWPIQGFPKAGDVTVYRCGFDWLGGHTFIAHGREE